MTAVSIEQARQARDKIRSLLKDKPAYRGVGIAADPAAGYAVEVNFSVESVIASAPLPEEIAGVPVRAKFVGEIHAGSDQSGTPRS